MHVGSKGWYVEKLKDKGVRHYEGRKIEKFKAHVLANLLEEKNKPTLNRSVHGLFFCVISPFTIDIRVLKIIC